MKIQPMKMHRQVQAYFLSAMFLASWCMVTGLFFGYIIGRYL